MFKNRKEAGQKLAARLLRYKSEHPVVLAIPRGGVPVGYEVALALEAPLDVIVVRKLGLPFQPELGMGAIGEDGVRVLNDRVIDLAGVTPHELEQVETRERAEIERRARLFRGDRPALSLSGRTVIVVDDGIATGGTVRAALQVARAHGAARIVLAVPVAPADTLAELAADADDIVCLETPANFYAIGQWYDDFSQTPDDEVRSLLADAGTTPVGAAPAQDDPPGDPPADPPSDPPGDRRTAGPTGARIAEIRIPIGPVVLSGELTIPTEAIGLVVFAHGSGSSRHSPRNRFVARALNDGRLATLLFDLLTPAEELDRANVFDVELLGARLAAVTDWLTGAVGGAEVAGLPIGYFGASTGAAAALWAAAAPGAPVRAVVSRGGRPDLAGPRLGRVQAPTLLIVGGRDEVVIELNRDAARALRCEHRIVVVPGATHLFEEPGTLEAVADLARAWFTTHLPLGPASSDASPAERRERRA
jgi:putative phosphoribosyl transferase